MKKHKTYHTGGAGKKGKKVPRKKIRAARKAAKKPQLTGKYKPTGAGGGAEEGIYKMPSTYHKPKKRKKIKTIKILKRN